LPERAFACRILRTEYLPVDWRHLVKRIAVAALFAASFGTLALGAQDKGLSFGVDGLRIKWFAVPTGLDLTAAFKGLDLAQGPKTILFAKAGGGYEDNKIFRDDATGEPLPLYSLQGGAMKRTPQVVKDWVNFQWELALIQGIIPAVDPATKKDNLLEAFAYYRGRFDKVLSDKTASVFPDRYDLVYTGFMGGLSLNALAVDGHGLKSGIYAEASLEGAPGALNPDKADYLRANAKLSCALPLFDMAGEKNLFSVYLADFASVDYAFGETIPLFVDQSFGGRDLRKSLGNCVRGLPETAFDSRLKAVNNLELRVNGPAFLAPTIMPIAYAFLDAGYYSGYSRAAAAAEDSGFLVSVGGGLALNLLDIAQVGVAVSPFQPVAEKSSFWFDIKLFLHF
jgi:hypothetical protein